MNSNTQFCGDGKRHRLHFVLELPNMSEESHAVSESLPFIKYPTASTVRILYTNQAVCSIPPY